MKTHTSNEPWRPRGPARGLHLFPSVARVWLLLSLLLGAGAVQAQQAAVIISQVIPAEDNSSYFDHEGDLPAVIFVKNNTTTTVAISGWGLSDNAAVPFKWVFPGGAVPLFLGAGETITVFASAKNRTTTPFATNFLLPCGSTAYLSNPQGLPGSQKTVSGENCPECIPLISPNSTAMWLVPSANNPPSTGGDWRLPAFNDSSWSRGQPCLGYDQDPLMQNMVLYSVFDTGTVDTVNRTITDVSGPVLHTGTWPLWTGGAGGSHIAIPLATLPKIIQNVGFTGPVNTSSYVQYATHTELDPGTGGYTWSVWIRPLSTDLQSSEVILRKGMDSSTSNAGYVMVRNSANNVSMQLLMPGFATVTATTAGGLFTRDVWHHVLATVTRGTVNSLTLYHNGVQRAQAAIPAGMNINTSLPMYLARAVAGGPVMYTGRMDDYATWNRALSAAEISRVFAAGNATPGKRIDDPTAPGASAPIYTPYIQTNVQTAMKGVNTSLYERINFSLPVAPSLVRGMTFRVRYDDGFIAYINGVEIARRNAPTSLPQWNSAAPLDRLDTDALTVEEIPVPGAALSALQSDVNILAIHALNATANDQRFLICPELCYDELSPEDCVVTTNGKLFWITFPGNAPEDITTPLRLSVCITGAAGTQGNVAIPGLAFSQNFTLAADGKAEVFLPKAASLEKSDTIENKGVRIIATQNVAVTGRTRIDYSTDTFLAHPIKCLGSNYLALCWGNSWAGLPDLNGTQFGIVATADNTHVTIRPTVSTGGHPAGVPYNMILNAGQTYMLRNLGDTPADLTGTEISSDSPVAVFGGHRCANVTGSLFFCDTVIEQTLPVALWNKEYVAAPLATRTGNELIRVVAAEDATTILINGVISVPQLNKGERRNYNVAGGAVFTSAKPFLATHLSRSSDFDGVINADPFQLNCQPTASWLSGYRFCTPPAAEFSGFHVNVLAKSGEIAGVGIVPAPVAAGAAVAIGATGYSYRQFTLAAGTTYTSSGRTHGLEIYGWGQYDSYGHSGGMRFEDTQPPTLMQCPPDVTIFTENIPGAGELALVPDFAKQFGVTDNCCPESSIVVVQTPGPGSRLQAGDYQVLIQLTDCNGNRITCAFTLHVRTDPRAAAFPGAFGNPDLEGTIWGWHANPDGDCLNNEQEYALGTNMAVAAPLGNAFTFSEVVYQGQRGVEVSYRKRNDDPGIDYTPEGSGDLVGWFSGLGHFEQTFSGPDALPGFTRIRAFSHDSIDFTRFFLRLDIRRN
jgi:hypothetical protein